jgi:hypothetical protein
MEARATRRAESENVPEGKQEARSDHGQESTPARLGGGAVEARLKEEEAGASREIVEGRPDDATSMADKGRSERMGEGLGWGAPWSRASPQRRR